MVCRSTKVVGAIGTVVTILAFAALGIVYMADDLGFGKGSGMGELQGAIFTYTLYGVILWLFVFLVIMGVIISKEKSYKNKYKEQKELAEYHANKLGFYVFFGMGLIITLAGLFGVTMIYMADELGLIEMFFGRKGAPGMGDLQSIVFNNAAIAFIIWVIIYISGIIATKPKRPEIKEEVVPIKKVVAEEEVEEEELVICPECGAEVAPEAEECPNCGASFIEEVCECPACGAEIPCDVVICPECGAEFEEEVEEVEEEAPSEEEIAEEGEVCECPECGAEIPCDATSCPNCGVEFEEEEEVVEVPEEVAEGGVEMGEGEITPSEEEEEVPSEEEIAEEGEVCECPECGAEIPCDATSCPNCGVEFEE